MNEVGVLSDPVSGFRGDLLASEAARFDEVCRFGQDRMGPLAATIAAAFANDPVWCWMFDSAPLASEPATALAELMIARVSPADAIHGFRDHGCVALWHAPDSDQSDRTREWVQTRSEPFGRSLGQWIGANADRAQALTEAMASARPVEPHWYLSVVATHPARQGHGLGARVLAPVIDRCERGGLAAYLESSNPRNHAFYHRLGFVETTEINPPGCPPLVGFIKRPR